ncbi:hypothetical protein Pint_22155 [Pistacia integerrima]|uniref:Uncharacterized protein n=1 Tax=Pistacia integerrima TaxID=434235 RepID=A0ACC0YPG7_9ROSI|nr:hypothetical protein Pint_22155 [Pistacia integerrima]
MSLVSFIILLLLLPYSSIAKNTSVINNDQNIYGFCQPTNCSENGPKIRFPFRLKTQSVSCGLEGFEMSCSNGKNMLHLPFASGYYVQDISYLSGSITIMDMNDTTCPIQSLLSPNLTNSRFSLEYDRLYQMYALLNCTVKITWTDSVLGPFDCISDERKFIYATDDQTYEYVWMPPVCSWYKTVNISIDYMYRDNQTEKIVIVWEALDGCWDCEKSGNYCGFNTTSNSTICIKNKLKNFSFDMQIIMVMVV